METSSETNVAARALSYSFWTLLPGTIEISPFYSIFLCFKGYLCWPTPHQTLQTASWLSLFHSPRPKNKKPYSSTRPFQAHPPQENFQLCLQFLARQSPSTRRRRTCISWRVRTSFCASPTLHIIHISSSF